jgi:hypothetical protein
VYRNTVWPFLLIVVIIKETIVVDFSDNPFLVLTFGAVLTAYLYTFMARDGPSLPRRENSPHCFFSDMDFYHTERSPPERGKSKNPEVKLE